MSINANAYSYLNQIFYPHNKFDDRLHELDPWMLTMNKIQATSCTQLKHTAIEPTVAEPVANDKMQIFSPVNTDTLFWCAYVIAKGDAEYAMIGNRYKNTEIEEKQKMIDFIKANPDAIKSSFKISAVKMKEIMSELMMDKKTSWTAFLAMCVYYKFSAIICYKRTFLEFSVKGADNTYLFHRDAAGHITVDTSELDEQEMKDIRDTRICLGHNPEKPLKAASHYKMDDLTDMADKLAISCGQNKWKKADWYEAILKELEW
jgi:hypothetical protein